MLIPTVGLSGSGAPARTSPWGRCPPLPQWLVWRGPCESSQTMEIHLGVFITTPGNRKSLFKGGLVAVSFPWEKTHGNRAKAKSSGAENEIACEWPGLRPWLAQSHAHKSTFHLCGLMNFYLFLNQFLLNFLSPGMKERISWEIDTELLLSIPCWVWGILNN